VTKTSRYENGVKFGYNSRPAVSSPSLPRVLSEDVRNSRQSPPISTVTSKTNQSARWIPPQFLHDIVDRNELVFRRVRGILNKLTPEKFDRLSTNLLNIGIDSKTILKGIIILIFEKAIDESKYCNLYAQLCKRLSEDAPNFDDFNSKTTTFRRLLLSKCQDEFETRSKATSKFDKSDSALSAVEQEERYIAKSKMLGNIKFIGELGKMGLVQEAILHQCIQKLLAKKKKTSLADMAEDIECLCQIMTTIGKRLDSPKAKNIMDQYFDRINTLSNSEELPSRIRFMLLDVLDLRYHNWIPRRVNRENGPRSVSEMRWEMMGPMVPPSAFMYGPPGMMPGMPNIPMPMMPPTGKNMPWFGGDPMFGGNNSVPGVTNPIMKPMGTEKNGHVMHDDNKDIFGKPQTGASKPKAPAPAKAEPKKDLFEPHYMKSKKPTTSSSSSNSNVSLATVMKHEAAANKAASSKKFGLFEDEVDIMKQKPSTSQSSNVSRTNAWNVDPFLPDFSRPKGLSPFADEHVLQDEDFNNATPPQRQSPQTNRQRGMPTLTKPVKKTNGEISLRPASMLATKKEEKPKNVPKTEELPGKMQQFTNLTISEKSKPKKAAPSKKDIDKRIHDLFEEYAFDLDLDKVVNEIQPLVTSTKLCRMVAKQLAQYFTTLKVEAWESAANVLLECEKRSVLSAEISSSAILQILDDPKVSDIDDNKNCLAYFAAQFISKDLLEFSDFVSQFQDGKHYPSVLLCAEHLKNINGKDWLLDVVKKTKTDLKTTFPKTMQTDLDVMKVAQEKDLIFLFPHLCLQDELVRSLTEEKDQSIIVDWIKNNVEPALERKKLIHIIVTSTVIIATRETLAEEKDLSIKPEKEVTEKEKDIICQMKEIIKTFLGGDSNMQLEAIYALQIFCFEKNFPKEMLLRLFIVFYSNEIVEEDVFMRWREDLNDTYPGKGKALFQVNTWLQWLETADEEEEEEEEDA